MEGFIVAQRFSTTSLILLVLIGPLLALAIKGFAVLLALAGIFAALALILQDKWPNISRFKPHGWPLALLTWISLSAIWSLHEDAGNKLVQLLLSLFFAISLLFLFEQLDEEKKSLWCKRISISIGLGLGLSLILGPWQIYAPNLADALSPVLELLRQVNRSLTIVAILVFIYAGSIAQRRPRIAVALLAISTAVAFYSESQSAALAMALGWLALGLARMSVKVTRRLILASFALSLLLIAPFSIRAFEERWSTTYLPQAIHNTAAPNIRSWIYYVYSKELLPKALFGHGLQSSRNFNPENLDVYVSECQKMSHSYRHCDLALENQTVAAHAHNLFLQILFELGIVGGVLCLFVLGKWLPSQQSDTNMWRMGAWGAGMGTLMFSYNFWQSWLMASLLICALSAAIVLPNKKGAVTS